MRIQYLSASGGLGGAEVCLLDMMASLQKEKPDWKLALIAAQDGPLVQKAAALGVRTEVLPFPAPVARLGDSKPSNRALAQVALPARLARTAFAARNYSPKLRQSIRRHGPDPVHSTR